TKAVPFRTAHGIVGALVAECEKQGKTLAQVGIDEFKEHCEVIADDVYQRLGAKNVAESYVSAAAGSPAQMGEQINYWKKQLGER
ncbi:MAG: argininosuccinate lyase, partial [Phycisphaerae bacterium]|nr:argininosuccinate lyase [Phycisphaerae bacterium]